MTRCSRRLRRSGSDIFHQLYTTPARSSPSAISISFSMITHTTKDSAFHIQTSAVPTSINCDVRIRSMYGDPNAECVNIILWFRLYCASIRYVSARPRSLTRLARPHWKDGLLVRSCASCWMAGRYLRCPVAWLDETSDGTIRRRIDSLLGWWRAFWDWLRCRFGFLVAVHRACLAESPWQYKHRGVDRYLRTRRFRQWCRVSCIVRSRSQ